MTKLNIIINSLLTELKNGNLKIGDKVPSEYQLAEQFDVNRTTANKAVTTLTNQGYFQRRKGRGGTYVIKTKKYPVGTIAYLTRISDNTIFAPLLLKGAQEAAYKNDYALQYIDPGNDFHHVFDQLKETDIEGMLISAFYPYPEMPFPVISVDRTDMKAGENENYIVSDNFNGGCQMTEQVIRAGHRNIVAYTSSPKSQGRRIDGIKSTLQKYGITDIDNRIFSNTNFELMNCLNTIQHGFDWKFPNYTAIITTSDREAIAFIKALKRMGRRVPEEISVTGFGNESCWSMNLTSMEQHPISMGAFACECLIKLIKDKQKGIIRKELSMEYIPGETLAIRAH